MGLCILASRAMESGTNTAALEIFYSYSHADEDLRSELERHLSVLQRNGLIRQWHDRKIDAGSEWAGRISEHLEKADVILLLVSSNFLASDYCWDKELKRALERHAAGSATVIPVILRPVDWHEAPFAHLQCLPADAKPITSWPNRDEAFRNVAEGIRGVVEGRASRPEPSRPGAQQRVLDAALAPRMPVGDTGQLYAMIRQGSSGGLRAVLQVEEVEAITPENVRSKPFIISFPAGPGGQRQPAIVTLSLDSPDFDPPHQSKVIGVPPDGDSEHCVFLLKPVRQGDLLLKLEVVHLGVAVATRVLKTNGATAGAPMNSSWVLASMPLTVMGYVGPARPVPAIGRLDVARPKPPAPAAPTPPEAARPPSDFTQAIKLPEFPLTPPPPASPPQPPPPAPIALPPERPARRMQPWLTTAATAVVAVGLIVAGLTLRQSDKTPPALTPPLPAKLAIKAPAEAQVFVDGVLQAVPLPQELALPPGPHSIRVLTQNGLERVTTVELKAGERKEVELH